MDVNQEKYKREIIMEGNCGECGGTDISRSMKDHTFPYGHPVSVALTVEIPVYKCNDEECNFQWYNWEAEEIMDEYIKQWKKEHVLEACNIFMKPIEVKHANLERVSDNSIFRSICPVCAEGTLLVGRDQTTFKLVAEDNCILCGQHFIYADINELRKKGGE